MLALDNLYSEYIIAISNVFFNSRRLKMVLIITTTGVPELRGPTLVLNRNML